MRIIQTFCLALAAIAAEARTYRATFTWYGEGDERGSPNCLSKSAACGFYTSPGLSAAVSQNLFGVGKDKGPGPYCGKCLKLNPETDKDGKTLSGFGKNVIVLVNNLCPGDDKNPLCAQSDTETPNMLGGIIDVNVCSDSGARQAVFGSSGVGLAIGTAEEVSCAAWNGTKSDKDSPDKGNSVAASGTGTSAGFLASQISEAGRFVSWNKAQFQWSVLLSLPLVVVLVVFRMM